MLRHHARNAIRQANMPKAVDTNNFPIRVDHDVTQNVHANGATDTGYENALNHWHVPCDSRASIADRSCLYLGSSAS